jgi:hypothetical protein
MSEKEHPLMQRPKPTPSDSSSWDQGVPEVPSAPDQPIGTNPDALIGPGLGRGGTAKPMQPLQVTETYCDPSYTGDPDEKYASAVDPAVTTAPQFEDVSSLLMRPRGAASDGD